MIITDVGFTLWIIVNIWIVLNLASYYKAKFFRVRWGDNG